jgi:amino acid transporter
VIITAFNTFGIEASSRLSIIALVLELLVYATFVVFAIIALSHGTADTHFTVNPIFNAKTFNFFMVMNGVSIAVLSFLGFEAISTLAEETKGGNKSVGKATVGALLLLGCLFVFVTWLAGCLWPNLIPADKIDVAFTLIAQRAGGTALLNICTIATAFSWCFAALTAQVAVSRVLFSMSRDGNFPKFLSKVHPRFKTPYLATWFIAGLSIIMCIIFQNFIDTLTSLVNFGALTSFFILSATVIYYYKFKLKAKGVFKYVIFPAIGCIVIAAVWINLSPNAKYVGVAWLIVGLIYYLILIKVFKKSADMEI